MSMHPEAAAHQSEPDPYLAWMRDMHQALACPLFGDCGSVVESAGETVCYRFPENPIKEGARIVCGNVRLAAAAYGLRLRGHGDLPVAFRRWLYEEEAPAEHRVQWCFGEQLSTIHEQADIFLVAGDPLSVSSWTQARLAARKAKAGGVLTLLLASMPYQATSLAEFHPEWHMEEADCLLHMDDGDAWFSFVAVLRILAACLRSGPSPALGRQDLRTIFPAGSECRIEYWMGARRRHSVSEWMAYRLEWFMNDSLASGAVLRSAFLAIDSELEPNEFDQAQQATRRVLPGQVTPLLCHRPRGHNLTNRSFDGMFFCAYQPPAKAESEEMT